MISSQLRSLLAKILRSILRKIFGTSIGSVSSGDNLYSARMHSSAEYKRLG